MKNLKGDIDLYGSIKVYDKYKNEYTLIIEGIYYVERKGDRDSLGVPLEPDEPAGFQYEAHIEGQKDLTWEEVLDLITYSEEELHNKIIDKLDQELDDLLDYNSYSFL
jgi:hypothetical protein